MHARIQLQPRDRWRIARAQAIGKARDLFRGMQHEGQGRLRRRGHTGAVMGALQHNNRPLGNQGAELQPLIQVCYAKAIRRLRSPYNARYAMAIGIGLHHRINSAASGAAPEAALFMRW